MSDRQLDLTGSWAGGVLGRKAGQRRQAWCGVGSKEPEPRLPGPGGPTSRPTQMASSL